VASLTVPSTSFAQGAGVEVYNAMPPGVDPFSLTLQETRLYSRRKNFQVVGHSYFKGPWLTPYAIQNGLGISTNTPRVYDGIGYFGGYNSPAIMFGTLIADVSNPANMKPLSFVPCEPGTRCGYIRVNNKRKILVIAHDTSGGNPTVPTPPQQARGGVSFHDVSDPTNPTPLGFLMTRAGGNTHGFEIDDRFAYVCANFPDTNAPISQNQGIAIVDYLDPRNPVLAARVNMPGNVAGGPPRDPFWDDKNPNGTQSDQPVPRDPRAHGPPVCRMARYRRGDHRCAGTRTSRRALDARTTYRRSTVADSARRTATCRWPTRMTRSSRSWRC
jgi:hypothetical protein